MATCPGPIKSGVRKGQPCGLSATSTGYCRRHGAQARERLSALHKKIWTDPALLARHSEIVTRAVAAPEVRAKMSAAMKRVFEDPKARERNAEMARNLWKDPDWRAKQHATRDYYRRPPCGTKHGYLAHRRRKETCCVECLSAWNEYHKCKRLHHIANILAFIGEDSGTRCMNPKCTSLKAPATIDHVVPLVHGGADTIENKQVLCATCNAKKRDKLDAEWDFRPALV